MVNFRLSVQKILKCLISSGHFSRIQLVDSLRTTGILKYIIFEVQRKNVLVQLKEECDILNEL